MGRVRRLGLKRFGHNLLDPVIADPARRAASGLVAQAIEAVLREPLAPSPHGLARNAHRRRDLTVVQPVRRAQDDLSPLCIRARYLAPSDTPIEHSPLIGVEFDLA